MLQYATHFMPVMRMRLWDFLSTDTKDQALLPFSIPNDDGESLSLQVRLEICPNPFCDCDEVTIDVFDGQPMHEESQYRVTVDPQKKIRKVRKDSTGDSLSLKVVDSFIEDD
ncbi:hypothetical protein N9V90_02340 [Endozoicomonas sp.]|nr:hypothetical protein [Endozoicomonas sp.]